MGEPVIEPLVGGRDLLLQPRVRLPAQRSQPAEVEQLARGGREVSNPIWPLNSTTPATALASSAIVTSRPTPTLIVLASE
jgi:hypothetical protein